VDVPAVLFASQGRIAPFRMFAVQLHADSKQVFARAPAAVPDGDREQGGPAQGIPVLLREPHLPLVGGVTRECAELIVAKRDVSRAENEEHQWVCIVPGDAAQHAYEVDEHGKAID
jgi:hypothetical protein